MLFGFDNVHLIGIAGAALIIFGFYRTSIGKWSDRSLLYELDNLIGATLMAIHELLIEAYIPMVLSVVWAIVAVRGITSFADRHGWYRQLQRKPAKRSRRK